MKRRTGLLGCVFSVLLGLALSGCFGINAPSSSVPVPSSPSLPTEVAVPAGKAVLDWANAALVLPLDIYGMSPHEIQVVTAASSIVFARCVTGRDEVDAAVLDEARKALTVEMLPDPWATHWLFGVWDEPFVAEHGWYPFPKDDPPPRFIEADQETNYRCANTPESRELNPINRSFASEDGWDALSRWAGESYGKTLETTEYERLSDVLDKCIVDAGYTPQDGHEGVHLDESWSEELKLKAKLVEAKCSDDMSYAQQLADIDAGFELEYIQANEAELVTIKNEVNRRIAVAEAILREAGVL